MVFGNGVKNIQAAAYNGARTVVLNFTIGFTLLCTKLSMCYMCALLLYILTDILTAGYRISPEST